MPPVNRRPVGIAFSWLLLFLYNTIPGSPLPENFGMNERLVGFKLGYLLSGISKTARSAINPAGYLPNFLTVSVIFYLCSYATSQKKNLDRNIAPPGVLGRCLLCAYFIEQFAYPRID
jgi:hypothetical protein